MNNAKILFTEHWDLFDCNEKYQVFSRLNNSPITGGFGDFYTMKRSQDNLNEAYLAQLLRFLDDESLKAHDYYWKELNPAKISPPSTFNLHLPWTNIYSPTEIVRRNFSPLSNSDNLCGEKVLEVRELLTLLISQCLWRWWGPFCPFIIPATV